MDYPHVQADNPWYNYYIKYEPKQEKTYFLLMTTRTKISLSIRAVRVCTLVARCVNGRDAGDPACLNSYRDKDTWAVTCDFQQCSILKSIDSYEPVQPLFKLRNSKCCSVSSLTVIEYSSDKQRLWSDCAYAQADLRLCWSHKLHCWKCHVAAHFFLRSGVMIIRVPKTGFLATWRKCTRGVQYVMKTHS